MKWSIFDEGNEHLVLDVSRTNNLDNPLIELLKARLALSKKEILKKINENNHKPVFSKSLRPNRGILRHHIISTNYIKKRMQLASTELKPNQYMAVAVTEKLSEGNGWVKVAVTIKMKNYLERVDYHRVATSLIVKAEQLLIVERAEKINRGKFNLNPSRGLKKSHVIHIQDRAVGVISESYDEDGALL